MKSVKISAVIILCFTLFSCGNSDSKNQNGDAIDIDAVINSKSKDPNARGDNKCLLAYQTKYDQLLGEDEIVAATGFSKEVMKTKSSTVLKNPENHSFEYKFNNGRLRTVPALGRKLEMPDVVKVGNIKAISLSAFEDAYRVISEEEMKVAKDVLNDVADGNSGDPEADAALKKAEKLNVSKEQLKKAGGGIMDVMKEVSQGYRVVEKLGDAARWNIVTNELYVLQNGVQFVILSEVNENIEKNKSVAIELAKVILNKCE